MMAIGYFAGHGSDPLVIEDNTARVRMILLSKLGRLYKGSRVVNTNSIQFTPVCICYTFQISGSGNSYDALIVQRLEKTTQMCLVAYMDNAGKTLFYPLPQDRVKGTLRLYLRGKIVEKEVGPLVTFYSSGIFVQGMEPQAVVFNLANQSE